MKQCIRILRLCLVAMAVYMPCNLSAGVYTVTNTNDAGAGSFRQAITDANANAGLDTIRFNIPDLGLAGQYFEGALLARYAVIRIVSALPVITDPLMIDGTSQPNTNIGSISGLTVGADNITQPSINYPDIYILCDVAGGYTRSSNTTNVGRAYGNGININAVNCTIRGIAISGFGNTSTSANTAGLSGDICVLRSATVRTANASITDCIIGVDARGNVPSIADRRSIGAAIVIGGNNFNGLIARNYMRNAGTYAVHFNGGIDHAAVGPSSTNLPNRNWVIEDNQFIDVSWNNSFVGPGNFVTSATGLVADAINTMNCKRLIIRRNFIQNVEQVGIDIGWNADSNYVENNSITGFTKTYAGPVQCGIRAALSSRGDTIVKNRIYSNSGTAFMAGIWIDQSAGPSGTTGISIYDNARHYIAQNIINNNSSSGIVLSTFTPTTVVNAREITISRNSIYSNAGIGIDLGFSGTTGPTSVTPNDNGDGDAGTNDLLNFPIIDSVKVNPTGTAMNIFGKAPAGALLEFFYADGGINNHGGFTLNYGEGQTFVGSATEGSVQDMAAGTGSYNIDGNVAVNNMNMFRFVFPISGAPPPGTRLTSTATLNFNTSEFSPQDIRGLITLKQCDILEFNGYSTMQGNQLRWKAECSKEVDHFELEYSIDNKNFQFLTRKNVDAGIVEEAYLHEQTESSVLYYRLKIVFSDGKFEYGPVILIRNSKPIQSIKLSPVPFQSEFTVQAQSATKTDVGFSILDVSGKRLFYKPVRFERGLNTVRIDQVQFLPPGNYILEITDIPTSVKTVQWIKKL